MGTDNVVICSVFLLDQKFCYRYNQCATAFVGFSLKATVCCSNSSKVNLVKHYFTKTLLVVVSYTLAHVDIMALQCTKYTITMLHWTTTSTASRHPLVLIAFVVLLLPEPVPGCTRWLLFFLSTSLDNGTRTYFFTHPSSFQGFNLFPESFRSIERILTNSMCQMLLLCLQLDAAFSKRRGIHSTHQYSVQYSSI